MFGYVNIYKDELKIKDYNTFRAYYCGLCKALSKNFNQTVRLGLSYDMTFLALLLSSVYEDTINTKNEICIAHMLTKKKIAKENVFINYSAYMSIILAYLKFLDDFKDEKSPKAVLGLIVYYFPFRKAKQKYINEYNEIKKHLDLLSRLEKNKEKDIDLVADCFSNALKVLFTKSFKEDEKTTKILGWLSYNLGRFIYILDAFCDIEKDYKKNNYNPFLVDYKKKDITNYKKSLKSKIDISLTFTLDNIAKSYELLNIKQNDEICRNIIYLGLKNRLSQALIL